VRLVRRKPKADPWGVYDALPAPIRAVLQEGPAQWDGGVLAARYRRWRGEYGEAAAVRLTVSVISLWNVLEIQRARPWQPPEWGRRKPLPSPHLAARATMQTSGRPLL
jgi:hypothetical protein